ncbi:MAG: class I mannose-6-phosphate isomerase, partial [Verrucomicrobiota bacterium]|nr:class I mannose-6-phosphate isomerase [Verrucomicrobiota bacterium]
MYPFIFKPIFKERIWGGRNLEKLYQKSLPPKIPIGESWEISDRPGDESVIANGVWAGKTLRWLMENYRAELLGNSQSEAPRFPLLIKILDAQEKLSLQVHPPAAKAAELGGEPKTEMWFIAKAAPGAELFVGLKRNVTRAEFETKIKNGTVADCFHRIKVKSGDAIFLPSGRVHAIGAGLIIFEIQQNSDTTYRVFDWNRLDA